MKASNFLIILAHMLMLLKSYIDKQAYYKGMLKASGFQFMHIVSLFENKRTGNLTLQKGKHMDLFNLFDWPYAVFSEKGQQVSCDFSFLIKHFKGQCNLINISILRINVYLLLNIFHPPTEKVNQCFLLKLSIGIISK